MTQATIPAPPPRSLRDVGQGIERMLDELRETDRTAAGRAEEILALLTELYGAGIERVMEIAFEAGGEELVDALADDGLVGSLLLLHGLHPEPVDLRVQRALDEVRPYLGSHAGGVEYLGIDDAGVVQLRLSGSCDGCPSSLATVKLSIEKAIEAAAPDVAGIAVEGVAAEPPPGGLLQIATNPPPQWLEGCPVPETVAS